MHPKGARQSIHTTIHFQAQSKDPRTALTFDFAPSLSIAMTAVNKNCSGCGASEDLHQCPTCAERMNGKGMSQALCVTCASDTDIISTFGGKPSAEVLGFTCNACSKFLERREQEKLFQTLMPPSPEKILRTIAGKFPWALTIARAEPDELFEALQILKRKLSGHRTVAALADSLANTNSHAAVLPELGAEW